MSYFFQVNASKPPDQVQAQMQQQYPWMANLGAVGFGSGGFPSPAFQGAYRNSFILYILNFQNFQSERFLSLSL